MQKVAERIVREFNRARDLLLSGSDWSTLVEEVLPDDVRPPERRGPLRPQADGRRPRRKGSKKERPPTARKPLNQRKLNRPDVSKGGAHPEPQVTE